MTEIKYKLIPRPNAYGFGHDWDMLVTDGKRIKTFMLGQDVKVVSRILGMSMDTAVDYYEKKSGSRNFETVKKYIARDILRVVLKTERLTQKELEKLFDANSWDLAVQ